MRRVMVINLSSEPMFHSSHAANTLLSLLHYLKYFLMEEGDTS